MMGLVAVSVASASATGGQWIRVARMNVARGAHTLTLLPGGRVLVAGGCGENDCTIRATELYDPATNTWSPAGLLALGRGLHQAARLPDGRVMVVGGTDGNVQFRSTEIYDPATGQWTTGPQLHDGRSRFGLTSVRRGAQALYLAASGCCVGGSISLLRTAEVYDPSRNQWFRVGNLNRPRKEFGFTTLGDGSALAAGGENREVFQQTSERFDPQTLMWQLTADNIPKAVAEVPLVTLDNGLALIAGGKLSDETEVQTPASAVFQP